MFGEAIKFLIVYIVSLVITYFGFMFVFYLTDLMYYLRQLFDGNDFFSSMTVITAIFIANHFVVKIPLKLFGLNLVENEKEFFTAFSSIFSQKNQAHTNSHEKNLPQNNNPVDEERRRREEKEAEERAFWNSPEGRRVRAEQMTAQIRSQERKEAEAMTIRIAEAERKRQKDALNDLKNYE